MFIRVDLQVAFTPQSIAEIARLEAFQNSSQSVMWTLKSILLAKLLNAGMNEWLLAPAQLVQLCPAILGDGFFVVCFYLEQVQSQQLLTSKEIIHG